MRYYHGLHESTNEPGRKTNLIKHSLDLSMADRWKAALKSIKCIPATASCLERCNATASKAVTASQACPPAMNPKWDGESRACKRSPPPSGIRNAVGACSNVASALNHLKKNIKRNRRLVHRDGSKSRLEQRTGELCLKRFFCNCL